MQDTDNNMAQAHSMLKAEATNTQSEYVTAIAFPLKQWLHERAPLLRYTYVVGSKSFRPNIQKPRQMENAVRDI